MSRMLLWQMGVAIAVWWLANTITNFASKSVMNLEEVNPGSVGATSWTAAFEDMRWIELTFLQHLFGILASGACLHILLKKPIWPSDVPKGPLYIAAVANVFGNLATNAGYALVSSSATQVVKALELIFTFFLSLCLYKTSCQDDFNFPTVVSILTMVVGACAFAVLDTSANIWSLIAAINTNIGFATRNIFFKRMTYPKESPIQKYAVISICSMFFLLPILVAKVVYTQVLFVQEMQESLTSGVSYFFYSAASIAVLQEVSPISHAVLNLSRRVVVILAKMVFIHEPPLVLTISIVIGLLVFISGLCLYYFRHNAKNSNTIKFTIFGVMIASCVYFQRHHIFGPQSIFTNNFFQNENLVETHLLDCPSTKYSPSTFSKETVFTAWAFERPIPPDIVANIKTLRDSYTTTHFHVYCGSSQCVCAISKLKNVTTEFLVASDLVSDTPLEQWLVRHPLNKLLAGLEFEDHLQRAIQLGILWKHGGVYIDPMVRMTGNFNLQTTCENGWIGRGDKNSILDVSCFPKQHPFIRDVVKQFVRDYPRERNDKTNFEFSFQNALRTVSSKCSTHCPESLAFQYDKLQSSVNTKKSRHFGTLTLIDQQQGTDPSILRSEMDSFSGLQFLPFVDRVLKKDHLKREDVGQDHVAVFFNGLWGKKTTAHWPPSKNIDPIMLSLKIDAASSVQFQTDVWTKMSKYLTKWVPIGCEDNYTLSLLRDTGVEAYFSGSLTLMMKHPNVRYKRSDKIYLVDVNQDIKEILPQEIQERGIDVQQNSKSKDSLERFTAAYELLESYASAKLVVTQRIHCALPCVAMGIPVVFINSPDMPGEERASTRDFSQLFHFVDLPILSLEEAQKLLNDFNWNNPPPNPNVGMLMRLRATSWNVIRQNQALYDAAHKFGLLPLQPFIPHPEYSSRNRLLFHLVFTTSKTSTIKLSKSSILEVFYSWRSDSVKGTWNWRHWRAIESIFYHHPSATVIVHSNTLQQSKFNVLTEVGYDVEVRHYNLEKLLGNSPAEKMIEKLPEAREGANWYAHEADLVRLLALYNSGGVYIDTDVVVVRPVDSLQNVAGWQDNLSKLNNAVLMFDAGNLYVKAALEEFGENYNSKCWACNGPDLLTRVYERRNEEWSVTALQNTAFYMFHPSVVKTQCFTVTSKETYEANMKILNEKAYVVHLNSKITANSGDTEGTICKHLLNSYCVLCNHQY